MSERIGIVTGGGDCPGLNAVIRAVAKAAAKRGWETIGFLGGYEGILEPQRYVELDYQKLGSLLTRGGTILGTANRGRFSAKVGHGETRRQAAACCRCPQCRTRTRKIESAPRPSLHDLPDGLLVREHPRRLKRINLRIEPQHRNEDKNKH